MKHKPPKPPTVRPSGKDFTPSEHAGVIAPEALRAVEKAPSPRNGRMVASSTALAEYRTSRDSVPIRGGSSSTDNQGAHGGMWDYEREAEQGQRRGPPRAQRYDADVMAAFVARHGNGLSANEWEVYTRFWVRRQSYAEVANEIGSNAARVYETIKRMRIKCHGARI